MLYVNFYYSMINKQFQVFIIRKIIAENWIMIILTTLNMFAKYSKV